jgi:hypothetical protein
VALVGLATALLSAPAGAEKYALLCGCAVYDKGPNPKPADLKTTVYDVLSLYELLVNRFEFKPENIRVLLSPPELWPLQVAPAGPATAANIAETFASWFARAGPDDLILFSYSGHGAFLHYQGEGAELHEEALLGSDYAASDPPQVLTFSQIRWLHSRLHDGQSVFVIDACHSGGGFLALDAQLSPYGPAPPVRYSGLAPETRPLETPALAAAGVAPTISPEALAAVQRRTVTLTACQSWEVASGAGPELRLLDKPQQTGVLTGDLVRAMATGPQNQSWEDAGRTARLLSVLGCIGQTIGVSGQARAAIPFTQPATPPTGPPYYLASPAGEGLAIAADPFLGAGSLLAAFSGAAPAGAALTPEVTLEPPATSAPESARLVPTPPGAGARAVVARRQVITLPKLSLFVEAADPLGRDQPVESGQLREQLGAIPYAQLCPSATDPSADYRLWVSLEDEDTTRPFARGRAADFPCSLVHGQPAGRSFPDSVTWLRGLLHYVRAVQGAAWARNHAAGFRVWVTPDKERPLYLPGAPAKLRLEASEACQVVVVVADSAGNVLGLGPQAVSPGQPAEQSFVLPAGGPAHDMRLAVIKAFAFRQAPEAPAVAKVAQEGRTDPAAAMLGLLRTALGDASGDGIPTEGWADNEAFVAVWDRTPLAGAEAF